jgi:hypothetical protein
MYVIIIYKKHDCKKNKLIYEKQKMFKLRKNVIKKRIEYIRKHGTEEGFYHSSASLCDIEINERENISNSIIDKHSIEKDELTCEIIEILE